MEITAFIMGICPPKRLEWLKQNIDFLDSQNFQFKEKILSIDQFKGYVLPNDLKEYFLSKGWKLLIDNHGSRNKSMDHLLNISSEYIFYNEDDVLCEMPNKNDLETIFNIKDGHRECGMVSLTVGGSNWYPESNNFGDLNFLQNNIIFENEKYYAFKRLESHKNNYFFEFPGLIIKSNIFKQCHQSAKQFRTQIEMALSLAYFHNNFDKQYYKCCLTKPIIHELIFKDYRRIISDGRLLRNLDENQGSGIVDGIHLPQSHNY